MSVGEERVDLGHRERRGLHRTVAPVARRIENCDRAALRVPMALSLARGAEPVATRNALERRCEAEAVPHRIAAARVA